MQAWQRSDGAAQIMGIVNVTPDSFSDGGRWLDPAAGIAHGQALAAAGADWLDIGGESTRPGSEAVPASVEVERVVPVIAGLRAAGLSLPISVDTRKATVARAALAAGADLVNDVGAGEDAELLQAVAEHGASCCLMHKQGQPRDMQDDPRYVDVVTEVGTYLAERVANAVAAGVARERVLVDPGIGFGKTLRHNRLLLHGLERLAGLAARPLLVGLSRKRLVASLFDAAPEPAARDQASHLLHAQLFGRCAVLRVHDVAGAVLARRAWRLLQAPR